MNTNSYSVRWIKSPHKFIKYNDEFYEILHLTKKFGYTDFSNEVDRINCYLTCDVMYVDEKGIKHIVSYKHRAKFAGRELIIYNNDGSVKFDEWVYIDVSKPMHNIFDINGNELTFGG